MIIDAIKQVIAEEHSKCNVIDCMVFLSGLTQYDMENEGSKISETEIDCRGLMLKIVTIDRLRVYPQRAGIDDLIEIRFALRDNSNNVIGKVVTMNYQDGEEGRVWETEEQAVYGGSVEV